MQISGKGYFFEITEHKKIQGRKKFDTTAIPENITNL